MDTREQLQTLKDNYVTEYNEKHRMNSEEATKMELTQEELEAKARQLKLEYVRAYNKTNKEKRKQYMKRYWEKKALENN